MNISSTENTIRLPDIITVQRKLSILQTIPLVGFLVISPIKLVVSILQMVIGLAAAILLSVSATLVCSENLAEKSFISLIYVGVGVLSFLYALATLASLGGLGCLFEGELIREGQPTAYF
jgi:hypothetical protein